MTTRSDRPYLIKGNAQSEQAEMSTINPVARNTEMRILIELQLQSLMMHQAFGITDDLGLLRQDVADSIT